jgi:hypothetical protein
MFCNMQAVSVGTKQRNSCPKPLPLWLFSVFIFIWWLIYVHKSQTHHPSLPPAKQYPIKSDQVIIPFKLGKVYKGKVPLYKCRWRPGPKWLRTESTLLPLIAGQILSSHTEDSGSSLLRTKSFRRFFCRPGLGSRGLGNFHVSVWAAQPLTATHSEYAASSARHPRKRTSHGAPQGNKHTRKATPYM